MRSLCAFLDHCTPHANLFFQELSTVYDHLQGYCEDDDYLLSTMAMRMKSKYDKY